VCYVLLPDRFSDGLEDERRLYSKEDDAELARSRAEKKAWAHSGGSWQGGNLRGLMTKLPYLKAPPPLPRLLLSLHE